MPLKIIDKLSKKYRPTYFLLLAYILVLIGGGFFLLLTGVTDFGLAALLLAIIMLGTKNSIWNLDNHMIEE